ncbi:MAG: alanine/glycine:cation symporter family protein [Phycisphaerales bacterium]
MDQFNNFLNAVNGVIWHNVVLYIVLGVGVLFTVWSVGCQYKALTHGVQVVRGKYDDKDDPGAITHFQALSAALSATVGLGNIAGVALAIMLGGPGAVFWMWVVGVVGMALKTTEVTLSMIYRNTEDPDNPHGGPMFVAHKGFAKMGLGGVGKAVGGIFVITLLISTITGGNMFQAWNVADITNAYFGVPQIAVGIFLAVVVGAVIIGGIKRIGAVAGRLVPFMCVVYLLAALYVIVMRFDVIPDMLKLSVVEAFSPSEATGAFLGGTAGYALLWGMKRALFSSEAGQGSSPIAHSAAKTDEPVREGVVAGLEPFIDTIVVCTLTSLVILSTGIWNRGPDLEFSSPTAVVQADGAWSLERTEVNRSDDPSLTDDAEVFTIVEAEVNPNTGKNLHRVMGRVEIEGEGESRRYFINWSTSPTAQEAIALHPEKTQGAWFNHQGATLTAKAFDSVNDGLGMWLITLAAWLFAISTMISWSYYGEQGVVYLFGDGAVFPYKILYCLAIVIAAVPALISTDAQLDNLTALGTGVMLWANIPIMLVFGAVAMRTYKDYFRRMKAGEGRPPHEAPPIVDVVEGHDHDKKD